MSGAVSRSLTRPSEPHRARRAAGAEAPPFEAQAVPPTPAAERGARRAHVREVRENLAVRAAAPVTAAHAEVEIVAPGRGCSAHGEIHCEACATMEGGDAPEPEAKEPVKAEGGATGAEATASQESPLQKAERIFGEAKGRVTGTFGAYISGEPGTKLRLEGGDELKAVGKAAGRGGTINAITNSSGSEIVLGGHMTGKKDETLLGTLVHEYTHAISNAKGPLGTPHKVRNEGITEHFTRQAVSAGRAGKYDDAVAVMEAENATLGLSDDVLGPAYFGGDLTKLKARLEERGIDSRAKLTSNWKLLADFILPAKKGPAPGAKK